MRYVIVAAVAALLLGGCSSTQGPGSDCDTCATAEAMPLGDNSAAAAASAAGGQRANQAPFSGEAGARMDPVTVVGRGAGNTSNQSSDQEHRQTASGGAQNVAVNAPADALASAASGGGVSAAVQEARATVAQWRSALALAMTEVPTDMAKLEFIRTNLMTAQADLNAAEAASSAARPNVTVNYNQDNQQNTLFGVSSSSTAGRPDPESVKAAAEALDGVIRSKAAAPSTFPPPAPREGEVPDAPPAGASPAPAPSDTGG